MLRASLPPVTRPGCYPGDRGWVECQAGGRLTVISHARSVRQWPLGRVAERHSTGDANLMRTNRVL